MSQIEETLLARLTQSLVSSWSLRGLLPKQLYLSAEHIPARYGSVPSLNGLRACSVLVVMLSHFVNANLFPGGFGVLVFFSISGFLITRLLFAELKQSDTTNLKNFYARRILRLYPVILVYSGIVLAAYLVIGLPINLVEPLSALFYFANYLYAHYTVTTHQLGTMPSESFGRSRLKNISI